MDTRTNNDLQNTTQKTIDWTTRTPLKPGMNTGALEGLATSAPLMTPVVLLLKQHEHIIWYGNRAGHQYTWINISNINRTWTPY